MENNEKIINYMDDILFNNEISSDFISSYSLDSYGYICDSIMEFADSETSIYYSYRKEFYNNNVELCENALLDYGYDINELLKNGDSLDDIMCKAGAIGEFMKNEQDLYDDIENIILYLICDYVLENNINISIDDIENISNNINSGDRWSNIIDEIEATQETENEE